MNRGGIAMTVDNILAEISFREVFRVAMRLDSFLTFFAGKSSTIWSRNITSYCEKGARCANRKDSSIGKGIESHSAGTPRGRETLVFLFLT